MIDFGLVALFAIELAMVAAVFLVFTRIKAEISTLQGMKADTAALAARFDALKESQASAIDALARRQSEVEAGPRTLLNRFAEMEAEVGKVGRGLEGASGKIASLQGRMSAIVKARKGRADDDDEDTGPAPEGEGILPAGIGIPLGPQNQERLSNQVIPPGFGKSSRRVG